MEISKESLEKMYVNPVMVPSRADIIQYYSPKLDFLKKIETENKSLKIRLMLMLFDPKSPLSEIRDYGQKSIEACTLLRIEYDKKELSYPDWVKKCCTGADVEFNRMAIIFIACTNSIEFAILEGYSFARLKLAASVMSNDSNARKELAELEKDILARKKSLFGESTSKTMDFNLDDYILESQLDLSPEGIAAMRRDGKDIFMEFSQYN